MPPFHRPRHRLALTRTCLGLLSALWMSAAPESLAAPKKKPTRPSRNAPASRPAEPAPEPAPASAATPAPAAETSPAVAPVKKPAEESALESRSAGVSRPPPPARAAPAPEPAASAPPRGLRLGLGPDLFVEGGRMSGIQGINTSRQDESFDYTSANFLSATAWLTAPVTSVSERLRVGAGLRLFGNYAAGGGRTFGFGLLNEVFALGEYGVPVAEKTEVAIGLRAGLSVLVPGLQFSEEIFRLRDSGVDVWNVPRVGWLVGPSAGARRRMSERIWLRADVLAQVERQFLFATSQQISGLAFSKDWSTLTLRLGLSLGAEFSL